MELLIVGSIFFSLSISYDSKMRSFFKMENRSTTQLSELVVSSKCKKNG